MYKKGRDLLGSSSLCDPRRLLSCLEYVFERKRYASRLPSQMRLRNIGNSFGEYWGAAAIFKCGHTRNLGILHSPSSSRWSFIAEVVKIVKVLKE